ncbi:MAG TPA: endonuclease/exonuclease/phosphatase family protein [Thermoanaerobaculia bacterium]|nr:endonuclease/exonuclease/phosphatase family protein [Thermoanaerobaculia bacterium]
MLGATTRKRVAIAFLIAAGCVLGWYGQSRLFARQRCVRVLEMAPRPASQATASPRSPAAIRVATFNIAHARGGEFGASNWTGASKEQVRSRLAKIARQVSDAGADILILNEVDFDASWSRSIDQAAEIARRAGFGYVAEQRNIDVTLPFRTFRFGNAISSRYPIANARAIHLPPFSRWEAALAGNHDGLVADVLTPIGRVRVVAVHLEYRSEDVRLRCARILKALAHESALPMIAVGDFNSIPGFARKHPEYVLPPDTAVAFLLRSGPLAVSKAPIDWNQYVTFPSASPDRAIDWILTSSGLTQGVPTVVPSDLSDHLMVVVPISATRI